MTNIGEITVAVVNMRSQYSDLRWCRHDSGSNFGSGIFSKLWIRVWIPEQ
jgi:hypothetical protein